MTSPTTAGRFPADTFRPDPRRAPIGRIVAAQSRMETLLILRHGEQLLLNLIIPVMMLIVASVMPVLGPDTTVESIFPMVLAVASTSSAFTGQAIALAFDRRYGALRRTGASGVPSWAIIVGKFFGVTAVTLVQVVVLGAVALAVGWRASVLGVLGGLVVLVLGMLAFSALGLLLGGSQSAEVVLAVANLIWVVLTGIVGWVLFTQGLADSGWWNAVPTVALASGLDVAFTGGFPLWPIISLLLWGVIGSVAAAKNFRFDG